MGIVDYSYQLGKAVLEDRSDQERKAKGQFLTPPPLARFMASQLEPLPENAQILDPAAGSGVLLCAIIEQAVQNKQPRTVIIHAYEIDQELAKTARISLQHATAWAESQGILIRANVYQQDFILTYARMLRPTLFSLSQAQLERYDGIIANPPYFKLNQGDPRARAVTGLLTGQTNIYALFMASCARLISRQGKMCFLVPRSFCSGAYFKKFRRDLLDKVLPIQIHLFDARDEAFRGDSVLQENLVITMCRKSPETNSTHSVTISTSRGINDIACPTSRHKINISKFVKDLGGTLYFRLPASRVQEQILDIVDGWPGSLEKFGFHISTGPVVAFRARSFLCSEAFVNVGEAVPLYWMNNVKPYFLVWPTSNGNKPQGIRREAEAHSLLVPNANYVFLRRFSAKEEPRRLIAAPFLRINFPYDKVGLENHLNYIYGNEGELSEAETLGLSALLGSSLMDHYFRLTNGNTQVNATELRALPLPPLETIVKIGQQVPKCTMDGELDVINRKVYEVLKQEGYLPKDFPILSYGGVVN
ncbi:MAG: hypothetical protein D6681_13580 [Calditrichaeota bacterium]|nr:MAG: hypothetical protein D6681_13580 [Calditrichota bacterium]